MIHLRAFRGLLGQRFTEDVMVHVEPGESLAMVRSWVACSVATRMIGRRTIRIEYWDRSTTRIEHWG